MKLRAISLALFVFGCGGQDVILGDGPLDQSPLADADGGQGPHFSEPKSIDAISSSDTKDDDPSLTTDLTEMYFDSKRDGGAGDEDIWHSERSTPKDPWSSAEWVSELNTDKRETGIALSADGLTIWFSSNRDGTAGGLDIYVSSRGTRTDTWSAPARVEELCSTEDDLVSAVSDDGSTMFLARRTSSDSDYDVFIARRDDPSGPWQAPAPLAEINTKAAESDAFLVGTGENLLFTRDEDIFLAERPGTSGPFTVEGPVKDLDSPHDDRDPWASDDFRYVVFSSDRSGSYLLYEAFR